ncbi:hypothetical protein AVEN_221700-1 [Araneus ventricosus]|uniref:Uncharacterized protein n=1 Tax=Araneus ventricosus TaxID=182803 RepID=A0A4Y2KQY6_ARAVE|nr:hypothetical protein AVEN_221700-1 [Araneus ventricosus]
MRAMASSWQDLGFITEGSDVRDPIPQKISIFPQVSRGSLERGNASSGIPCPRHLIAVQNYKVQNVTRLASKRDFKITKLK